MSNYRVSIDIGGTFTDCTIVDGNGAVTIAKSPSTPDDFSKGFIDSLETGASALGVELSELLAQIVKHLIQLIFFFFGLIPTYSKTNSKADNPTN